MRRTIISLAFLACGIGSGFAQNAPATTAPATQAPSSTQMPATAPKAQDDATMPVPGANSFT
jgi:hypothetical protein